MSLVGPRPALLSQYDVLHLREQYGVDVLKPGITGLAQITGRDDLTNLEKVRRDTKYSTNIGPITDAIILFYTLKTLFNSKGNY